MTFSFEHRIEDQVCYIDLIGRIAEIDDSIEFLEEVDHATLNGISNIIIDLSKLEYINSSGLNALINSLTKARNAGGDCLLCCVNEKISKLFIITKLNTLFTITETKAEAKNFFNENLKV